MALAIDSQMAASAGAGGATGIPGTLTFAFTNTAGTFLLVGVSCGNSASGFTPIVSVTYNGVTMTQEVSIQYDGGNKSQAAIYSLLNPATGANNVVITLTGASGSATSIEGGAMSFTGNNITTPVVAGSGKTNFRDANGTTATVTSGTTTAGNIAVAQMATGNSYVSTSQTLSWSKNQATTSAGGNGAMTYASGTGGTIGFSDTTGNDWMGMCCLEVAAAAGGASRGLFRAPSLSGLGAGGSFFRDPLAAPIQMVRRDRIFVPVNGDYINA